MACLRSSRETRRDDTNMIFCSMIVLSKGYRMAKTDYEKSLKNCEGWGNMPTAGVELELELERRKMASNQQG